VFENDALLLIGHGSTRYPDAGRPVQAQVEHLRAAGVFREVSLGLLNGAPSISESLAGLAADVVRVVPFFMEDGFFTRVAVPRALGAGHQGVATRFLLCPPVGEHDGMADLLERRVIDSCAALDLSPAATAVLVVGHGSARAPGRALALHRQTARVAARGLFGQVRAACLEEAPFVADALQGLRAYQTAVVGFFAGHGGHVRDDVPTLVAAERAARGPAGLDVRNLGSVTDTAAMTRIILEQAAKA